MKLYLLGTNVSIDYDSNSGFVVAAASEEGARLLCQSKIADEIFECSQFWLDPKYSYCMLIANESIYV